MKFNNWFELCEYVDKELERELGVEKKKQFENERIEKMLTDARSIVEREKERSTNWDDIQVKVVGEDPEWNTLPPEIRMGRPRYIVEITTENGGGSNAP